MAIEIVYETHSTTTDNEAGIATGWLPGRLSELGRRQAVELGKRRRAEHFSAIHCSDLARAVETARLAFPDREPHQDPRLRECNYGSLNGTSAAVIAGLRPLRLDEPYPGGGQSYREVVAATAAFLTDLAAAPGDDTDPGTDADPRRVLIIAHSANRLALEHLLNGRALPELLAADPVWQPGWHFTLPANWLP
ncbi:histidine phosphatase family protein [Kitasatospora sp. NPDC096147]|uniref:histidine phosphatase family protein n=1 Tax=Kitasatospora sp. NPDC096147 TaxID=3364093 RepID=UPI0037F85300